mgnify:CR=1 FL=1
MRFRHPGCQPCVEEILPRTSKLWIVGLVGQIEELHVLPTGGLVQQVYGGRDGAGGGIQGHLVPVIVFAAGGDEFHLAASLAGTGAAELIDALAADAMNVQNKLGERAYIQAALSLKTWYFIGVAPPEAPAWVAVFSSGSSERQTL